VKHNIHYVGILSKVATTPSESFANAPAEDLNIPSSHLFLTETGGEWRLNNKVRTERRKTE